VTTEAELDVVGVLLGADAAGEATGVGVVGAVGAVGEVPGDDTGAATKGATECKVE
jgi:hypothetical protein